MVQTERCPRTSWRDEGGAPLYPLPSFLGRTKLLGHAVLAAEAPVYKDKTEALSLAVKTIHPSPANTHIHNTHTHTHICTHTLLNLQRRLPSFLCASCSAVCTDELPGGHDRKSLQESNGYKNDQLRLPPPERHPIKRLSLPVMVPDKPGLPHDRVLQEDRERTSSPGIQLNGAEFCRQCWLQSNLDP